jgi:hypothetical protein
MYALIWIRKYFYNYTQGYFNKLKIKKEKKKTKERNILSRNINFLEYNETASQEKNSYHRNV